MVLTCVVLEPDGVKVKWWTEIKDMRIFALQKVWDAQFWPDREEEKRRKIRLVQEQVFWAPLLVQFKKKIPTKA